MSGYSHRAEGSHSDDILNTKGQKAPLQGRDPAGIPFTSHQTYYQEKC